MMIRTFRGWSAWGMAMGALFLALGAQHVLLSKRFDSLSKAREDYVAAFYCWYALGQSPPVAPDGAPGSRSTWLQRRFKEHILAFAEHLRQRPRGYRSGQIRLLANAVDASLREDGRYGVFSDDEMGILRSAVQAWNLANPDLAELYKAARESEGRETGMDGSRRSDVGESPKAVR